MTNNHESWPKSALLKHHAVLPLGKERHLIYLLKQHIYEHLPKEFFKFSSAHANQSARGSSFDRLNPHQLILDIISVFKPILFIQNFNLQLFHCRDNIRKHLNIIARDLQICSNGEPEEHEDTWNFYFTDRREASCALIPNDTWILARLQRKQMPEELEKSSITQKSNWIPRIITFFLGLEDLNPKLRRRKWLRSWGSNNGFWHTIQI